ncbi:hypothetical protein TRAPUB_8574, partial [Trametes pubescens]
CAMSYISRRRRSVGRTTATGRLIAEDVTTIHGCSWNKFGVIKKWIQPAAAALLDSELKILRIALNPLFATRHDALSEAGRAKVSLCVVVRDTGKGTTSAVADWRARSGMCGLAPIKQRERVAVSLMDVRRASSSLRLACRTGDRRRCLRAVEARGRGKDSAGKMFA